MKQVKNVKNSAKVVGSILILRNRFRCWMMTTTMKLIGKIKQYTEGEETFTAEDAEEEVVIAGIAEVGAAEVNQ